MHLILTACILWVGTVLHPAMTWSGQTLERVRANGVVRCGVSEGLPGFSLRDQAGHWRAFEPRPRDALQTVQWKDSRW